MQKHILLGVVVCLLANILLAENPLQVEVDRIIPAEVLLDMIGDSSRLSSLQRVGVKCWVRLNVHDIKRVVKHIDQPESFEDVKRDLLVGIAREGVSSDVESAIKGVLDSVEKDSELIRHVNDHLRSGNRLYDQERQNIFMHCKIENAAMDRNGSLKSNSDCNKAKAHYKSMLRSSANKQHGKFVDQVTDNFIHD